MTYEKAHFTQITRPTLELSLYKDPNRLFKKFQELKNIKLSSVPGRVSPKRNMGVNGKSNQKFTLLAELTKSPRHKVNSNPHANYNNNSLNSSLNTNVSQQQHHYNHANHNSTPVIKSTHDSKKVTLKSSSTPRRTSNNSSSYNNNNNNNNNQSISTETNSKSRIYTSFLEHKSANPFESNLNILTKSNPSFYMGLAKENGLIDTSINSRFANANSYMNFIDYSLDSRILNKLLVSQSPATATEQINGDIQKKLKHGGPGVDLTNSSSKFSKNLFINFRKNDEKIILKKPILEKSSSTMAMTKTKSISGRSSTKKARSNSGIKKSALPENKSLKEFSVNKSPNQSLVLNNNNPINTNNSKKKENMAEVTCRVYTDEAKYVFIKAWLDEVERVHALEGKYLETINKISFYD